MSDDTPEWKQSLPEQLQNAPYFKAAESVDQVLADLNNAAQWQGNSLRIPGPDASPEAVAEFQQKAVEKIPGLMPTPNLEDNDAMAALFGKLGRPESADKYTLAEGLEAPDGLAELAFQANMTNTQYQSLVQRMVANEQAMTTQMTEAQTEAMSALKGEWGQAYDDKMTDIGKLLANAPESVKQAYQDGTLPAEQLRWLDGLSALGDEGAQLPGQDDGREVMPTPQEAEIQLAEVTTRLHSLEHGDPLRPALIRKQVALVALANGERPPEGFALR